MTTIMMRLGQVLFGTNADLGPKPGDEESDENGRSDDSTDGEDGEDGEGNGKGKGDESKEDGDAEGEGKGDGEGEEDAEGKGKADGDDGEGEGQKPDALNNKGGEDGGGEGPKEGTFQAATDESSEDHESIAAQLLDAMEAGEDSGRKDNNSALEGALEGEREDREEGECPFNPYCTELDSIYRPKKTEERKRVATRYKKQVKTEIAAIRSKLRNKFLQANQQQVIHGVRRGKSLSERRLVNSMIELKSGRRPTRPDWNVVQKEACTLTAAVVVDESGSMSSGDLLKGATKASIAISEALDTLGAPVLVVGPRNAGAGYQYPTWETGSDVMYEAYPEGHQYAGARHWEKPLYSRVDSSVIDVFKDWHERSSDALPRFAAIQACGSTPLSDGIQFALQELQERTERHRVVFVITDGCPDNSPCVRWQIRTAAEAGVTIVGIGIGYGASYVKELFPVHVYAEEVSDLPRELLQVLENIMFPKRARKMNLGDKKMKSA
jgi:cobalamin biosynthesis protein CobT